MQFAPLRFPEDEAVVTMELVEENFAPACFAPESPRSQNELFVRSPHVARLTLLKEHFDEFAAAVQTRIPQQKRLPIHRNGLCRRLRRGARSQQRKRKRSSILAGLLLRVRTAKRNLLRHSRDRSAVRLCSFQGGLKSNDSSEA